jgi:NAD(P)-dependent dehydrogenase (short-subunit alcohol dehydrogenase family)
MSDSPTRLFSLHGHTALVTGASRGIGEAIAHLLAAQGAHVICSSRRLEACEAVAAAIRAAGGSAEARAGKSVIPPPSRPCSPRSMPRARPFRCW